VRHICQWVGEKVACSGMRCNGFLADRHVPTGKLRERSVNRRPLALWPKRVPVILSQWLSLVTGPYVVMDVLRVIVGDSSGSSDCLRWNEREPECGVPGSQAGGSVIFSIRIVLKSSFHANPGSPSHIARASWLSPPDDEAMLLGSMSKAGLACSCVTNRYLCVVSH
jgi:hypothetical protein